MAKRYARGPSRRGAYKFTPARRNQLRKAAIISAQKRKGRRRKVAVGVVSTVAVGAVTGAAIYRHKASGSTLGIRTFTPQNARPTVGHNTSQVRSGATHRGIPLYETRHHVHAGAHVFGAEVTYKHRSIKSNREITRNMLAQEDRNKSVVHGTKVRVDRNAIPHYKLKRSGQKFPQGRSTNLHWPHLNEADAREQNWNIMSGHASRQHWASEAERLRRSN